MVASRRILVADAVSQIVVHTFDSMPLVPPLRTQFPGKLVPFRKILQRHALAIYGSRIGHGHLRYSCADEHQDAEAVLVNGYEIEY